MPRADVVAPESVRAGVQRDAGRWRRRHLDANQPGAVRAGPQAARIIGVQGGDLAGRQAISQRHAREPCRVIAHELARPRSEPQVARVVFGDRGHADRRQPVGRGEVVHAAGAAFPSRETGVAAQRDPDVSLSIFVELERIASFEDPGGRACRGDMAGIGTARQLDQPLVREQPPVIVGVEEADLRVPLVQHTRRQSRRGVGELTAIKTIDDPVAADRGDRTAAVREDGMNARIAEAVAFVIGAEAASRQLHGTGGGRGGPEIAVRIGRQRHHHAVAQSLPG